MPRAARQARQPSDDRQPQIMDAVLHRALSSVVSYCAAEETRRELEAKFVAPVLERVSARFSWAARLFQALALLLCVQTLLLAWLLVRVARR